MILKKKNKINRMEMVEIIQLKKNLYKVNSFKILSKVHKIY